jgi:hypothetical protein
LEHLFELCLFLWPALPHHTVSEFQDQAFLRGAKEHSLGAGNPASTILYFFVHIQHQEQWTVSWWGEPSFCMNIRTRTIVISENNLFQFFQVTRYPVHSFVCSFSRYQMPALYPASHFLEDGSWL